MPSPQSHDFPIPEDLPNLGRRISEKNDEKKSPMKRKTVPILFLITLLFAATASVQNLHAATLTVSNTNDSGAGSLRQAISDSSSGDTINFDSSVNGQTITLTSDTLQINKNLTITGPGANLLAINGNANGVFFINESDIDVTIAGLTITNGAGGYGGGGIHSFRFGTLTITNCTLSGNSGHYSGGGIYSDTGTL